MNWATQRLEEVMVNITSDPSASNVQTQVMRLAEDECYALRRVVNVIENSLYDREKIYDLENGE
jgi:hypothetical protein|tara:strand:+ start:266 stop:457 length:192 start_codon:yes stop_codon:yes gene_type:complete